MFQTFQMKQSVDKQKKGVLLYADAATARFACRGVHIKIYFPGFSIKRKREHVCRLVLAAIAFVECV